MRASLAWLALMLDVRGDLAPDVAVAEDSVVIESLTTAPSVDAQVWVLPDATVVVWLDER